MIRVITISREYGSGGSTIARMVAERLRWKLIDTSLIAEIARRARVQPEVAERFDECLDPWFHRLNKALWQGGYEGVASRVDTNAFDADAMAALWQGVIQEAAQMGSCVAVGRGGQCILEGHQDVFHVSIYAPLEERIERIRARVPPAADPAALAEETDRTRAAYVRRYFGRDWQDRRLYSLVICSSIGLQTAAKTILCAAGLEDVSR